MEDGHGWAVGRFLLSLACVPTPGRVRRESRQLLPQHLVAPEFNTVASDGNSGQFSKLYEVPSVCQVPCWAQELLGIGLGLTPLAHQRDPLSALTCTSEPGAIDHGSG